MCGGFELRTEFEDLPSILKKRTPRNFSFNYKPLNWITKDDPLLVLKKENKSFSSSYMLWGFLPSWRKTPKVDQKSYNARLETVGQKKSFRGAWQYRRCLIPASGFFEKNHLIRRKDLETFWIAGIWERWIGLDGSEVDTCALITREANNLIKKLHSRMPAIIENGYEELWMKDCYGNELDTISSMLLNNNYDDWISEPKFNSNYNQLSLI